MPLPSGFSQERVSMKTPTTLILSLIHIFGVQAYSGLIQDQDVWEADQRLGQPHPLAVALGRCV